MINVIAFFFGQYGIACFKEVHRCRADIIHTRFTRYKITIFFVLTDKSPRGRKDDGDIN